MIYEILTELRESNSRNYKEEVLRKHKDNALWLKYLLAVYNPYVQYYVRKLPKLTQGESSISKCNYSIEWALDGLSVLSERERTGHAAIKYLEYLFAPLDTEDRKALTHVIQRDIKAGVNVTTINKIYKKLIPTFDVQLCERFTMKNLERLTYPAYAQVKEDGKRMIVKVDGINVNYYNRSGKEASVLNHVITDGTFTALDMLFDKDETLAFDGEIRVLDKSGERFLPRAVSNGLVNRDELTEDEYNRIRFIIWDVITWKEFIEGKSDIPYDARFDKFCDILESITSPHVIAVESEIVNSVEETLTFGEKQVALGNEGAIIKNIKALYTNKRSKEQVKIKAEEDCDLIIVGVNPGKVGGKYEHMVGALVCESSDGLLRVKVSGMDDEVRAKDFEYFLGKIAAVKYNEKIKSDVKATWSLYLPRLIEVRDDKLEADSLNEIK